MVKTSLNVKSEATKLVRITQLPLLMVHYNETENQRKRNDYRVRIYQQVGEFIIYNAKTFRENLPFKHASCAKLQAKFSRRGIE